MIQLTQDILYSIIGGLLLIIGSLLTVIWSRVSSHMERDDNFQNECLAQLGKIATNHSVINAKFDAHLIEANRILHRLELLECKVDKHDIRLALVEARMKNGDDA